MSLENGAGQYDLSIEQRNCLGMQNKHHFPKLTLAQAGMHAEKSFSTQPKSVHFLLATACQSAATLDDAITQIAVDSTDDQIDLDDCTQYIQKLTSGGVAFPLDQFNN